MNVGVMAITTLIVVLLAVGLAYALGKRAAVKGVESSRPRGDAESNPRSLSGNQSIERA